MATKAAVHCLFLVAIGCAALAGAPGAAVAVTESYAFNATLQSGAVMCGEDPFDAEPCPELFGVVDEPNTADDLMVGMSIGGTYPGRIDLVYRESVGGILGLVGARCVLNGRNCLFDDEFLPLGEPPLGPSPGVLDFTLNSIVTSRFFIDGKSGRYLFETDFWQLSDGTYYYYDNVRFGLSEIKYIAPVPLPLPVTSLAVAVASLGLLRRRVTRRV
jgi:hypothetical protein